MILRNDSTWSTCFAGCGAVEGDRGLEAASREAKTAHCAQTG